MIEHTFFLPIFTAAIDEKYFRGISGFQWRTAVFVFKYVHKATNKGLEEQTIDKVIDMEDFINKTEEALRLLIKWQK